MANDHYYYYDNCNNKLGPVSKQRLRELASRGTINADTLITLDGQTKFPAEHLHLSSSGTFDIFDIGFTRFISNTWISIIWVILIIAHFIGGVVFLFAALNNGDPRLFLVALVVVPVSLLLCRMSLELNVIFFRIESNTRKANILLAQKSPECQRDAKSEE